MATRNRRRIRAFRVKDLMINVVPQSSDGGTAGMPNPDDDIDPRGPGSPIIRVAQLSAKLFAMGFFSKVAELDLQVVDHVALNIGRAALAPALSAALCTEDMATCQANPRISPYASLDQGLRFQDLIEAKVALTETLNMITEIEDARLAQARKLSGEFIPRLEGALDELKGK